MRGSTGVTTPWAKVPCLFARNLDPLPPDQIWWGRDEIAPTETASCDTGIRPAHGEFNLWEGDRGAFGNKDVLDLITMKRRLGGRRLPRKSCV